MRVPGGSHFISFLLSFALELLLFLGNGASVAFAVLGILSYVKRRQRLPLNLAGAVVSGLSMLTWLITTPRTRSETGDEDPPAWHCG